MYLGALSLEVRYNLRQTEEMMSVLEADGVVRRATEEEKQAHCMQPGCNAYALVEAPTPAKARF